MPCAPNAAGILFECCGLICDGVFVGSAITEYSFSFDNVVFDISNPGSPRPHYEFSNPLQPGRWHYHLEAHSDWNGSFLIRLYAVGVNNIAFGFPIASADNSPGNEVADGFYTIPPIEGIHDRNCWGFVLRADIVDVGQASPFINSGLVSEYAPLP